MAHGYGYWPGSGTMAYGHLHGWRRSRDHWGIDQPFNAVARASHQRIRAQAF